MGFRASGFRMWPSALGCSSLGFGFRAFDSWATGVGLGV